ncbi:extracellular solute-binding protein [Paenibacillus sp. IITD108]|uniref:extracellular solute-binding protein n=1 Tax=Paenibacillus sp. IITD108 TaxID=3116649 RepID=UPI002F42E609
MAIRRRLIGGLLSIILLSATISGAPGLLSSVHGEQAADTEAASSVLEDLTERAQYTSDSLEPFYAETLKSWLEEGIPSGSGDQKIAAVSYVRASSDAELEAGYYKGKSDVLLWPNQKGWVEYEVEVQQEGLYQLSIEYYPFGEKDGGSNQPVIFGTRINGEYPFREARSIAFARSFYNKPFEFDEFGNQIRPLVNEMGEWRKSPFSDSGGAYALPQLWRLKKGKNTIRLESLREPVAIREIEIAPPKILPAYSEVKEGVPTGEAQQNEAVVIEAEHFNAKNSSSIQIQYDKDPLTTPHSLTSKIFNTVGGNSWNKGRQSVTWEFDVPEDGLYKIAFRAYQGFRKNSTVFRKVYIDGEVPFAEMVHYPFPYKGGWHRAALQDDDDKPYEFYLTQGRHSITLEAHYEPYATAVASLERMGAELRSIAWEIRVATGNREDKLRVWNVEKEIPGVTDRLKKLQQQLTELSEQIISVNGAANNVSQALKSGAKDIESLLKRPDEIPYRNNNIAILQEKLEGQLTELQESPLQLDKLFIVPAKGSFPRMSANFFEKVSGSVKSLYHSFSDQNQFSKQQDDELNVWMMWGRDYVDELQQLANEKFTPEYGVKVRVNLIQSSDLLVLGKAAGILPDLALGIPGDMPFQLALRNAALDVSELPGGKELLDSYHPGSLLPYYYDGGYYAVPETMNFKVLFYRKDILGELGLNVPDTWDDVYAMMPALLQNEYNFYIDPADFSYIFFQNGVELYSPDGMSTALNRPEAFDAFGKWLDMFNVYGMERQVQSFYNQFRRGTMPIGVADFNMYIQLLVAAPEILNEWGIAPVPGTLKDDGSLVRWSGASGNGAMLFKDTPENKQKLAWQFLQWYVSDEVQTEFGMNLEQYRGETFRWNSANVRAFARMPWKKDDLKIILEQWQWIKEIPSVPGGYMTTRELSFAWNRSAISGGGGTTALENPRISLEKAVREINRELTRKQLEFDFIDHNGKVLKTQKLPQVTEPWKGADIDVR